MNFHRLLIPKQSMVRQAFVSWLAAIACATAIHASELDVDQAVRDLGHESFEARESATAWLMQSGEFTDARLAQALSQSDPESRHRLARVALHRFFSRQGAQNKTNSEDTGALGVDLSLKLNHAVFPSQDPTLQHPAILVSGTLPGFPAHAKLRPGDLILALDGVYFSDDLDTGRFTETLKQKYKAGQTVVARVRRDRRELEIPITLDSKARLDAVYTSGPQDEATMLRHDDFKQYFTTLVTLPEIKPLKIQVQQDERDSSLVSSVALTEPDIHAPTHPIERGPVRRPVGPQPVDRSTVRRAG